MRQPDNPGSNPPPAATGETYFFRDRGQFDLLRFRLLPELIGRRREAAEQACRKALDAHPLPPGEMVEPYETTAAELAKWLV